MNLYELGVTPCARDGGARERAVGGRGGACMRGANVAALLALHCALHCASSAPFEAPTFFEKKAAYTLSNLVVRLTLNIVSVPSWSGRGS